MHATNPAYYNQVAEDDLIVVGRVRCVHGVIGARYRGGRVLLQTARQLGGDGGEPGGRPGPVPRPATPVDRAQLGAWPPGHILFAVGAPIPAQPERPGEPC